MKCSADLSVDEIGVDVEMGNGELQTEVLSKTKVKTNQEIKVSQPLASTSKLVTLEPYSIKDNAANNAETQRRKKHKFRLDPTLIHFDHLFGTDNWSRFLLIETESPITATKLENYLLTECPSKDMALRQLNYQNWLVEVTTKSQSEKYQALTALGNIKINVKKHDKLNSIYGTVVLPNYEEDTDKETLLDSLKKRYPNVEDLEIYQIPQRNSSATLKIAKIKFEGQSLPTDVKIMGQKRELRPHVPKPLQCKQCSKYGHSTNKCRNEPVCAFCGSTEHSTRWNCGEMKCINCDQNHHARSKRGQLSYIQY